MRNQDDDASAGEADDVVIMYAGVSKADDAAMMIKCNGMLAWVDDDGGLH